MAINPNLGHAIGDMAQKRKPASSSAAQEPTFRRSKARSSTRAFSKAAVYSAIRRFRALLEANAAESAVHAFLSRHIYFWNGSIRLVGNSPLYSRIHLGSDYEIDFAYFDTGSNGAEWHLVEIEPPSARILNGRGDPSEQLTRSLGQVRRWQAWITSHSEYARTIFPGIDHPMGHIYIGRRSQLQKHGALAQLHAINLQNRSHVEVRTLDRFIDMARTSLGFLHTNLPAKALGDRDLRNGLPPEIREWITSPFGRQRLFLEERKRRDFFDEDEVAEGRRHRRRVKCVVGSTI